MMMKRVFTLLAWAACVSAGQAFVPHRGGGAQKAVGKKAVGNNNNNKAKVVAPKKCVNEQVRNTYVAASVETQSKPSSISSLN
eukprot:scaffold27929_cov176-Amphora_coffeaeformis.AAC.1